MNHTWERSTTATFEIPLEDVKQFVKQICDNAFENQITQENINDEIWSSHTDGKVELSLESKPLFVTNATQYYHRKRNDSSLQQGIEKKLTKKQKEKTRLSNDPNWKIEPRINNDGNYETSLFDVVRQHGWHYFVHNEIHTIDDFEHLEEKERTDYASLLCKCNDHERNWDQMILSSSIMDTDMTPGTDRMVAAWFHWCRDKGSDLTKNLEQWTVGTTPQMNSYDQHKLYNQLVWNINVLTESLSFVHFPRTLSNTQSFIGHRFHQSQLKFKWFTAMEPNHKYSIKQSTPIGFLNGISAIGPVMALIEYNYSKEMDWMNLLVVANMFAMAIKLLYSKHEEMTRNQQTHQSNKSDDLKWSRFEHKFFQSEFVKIADLHCKLDYLCNHCEMLVKDRTDIETIAREMIEVEDDFEMTRQCEKAAIHKIINIRSQENTRLHQSMPSQQLITLLQQQMHVYQQDVMTTNDENVNLPLHVNPPQDWENTVITQEIKKSSNPQIKQSTKSGKQEIDD